MFDIVKKLMMGRQISLERGKIILLEQPIVMQTAEIFSELKRTQIERNLPDDIIYISAKNAGKVYQQKISGRFKMSTAEGINWGVNSFELGGWGITEVVNLDVKNHRAIIRVENSTISHLYGKSDKPIDDTMAGFIAGAACVYWGIDMDAIETKCLSKGDPYCEFIVMESKALGEARNK